MNRHDHSALILITPEEFAAMQKVYSHSKHELLRMEKEDPQLKKAIDVVGQTLIGIALKAMEQASNVDFKSDRT